MSSRSMCRLGTMTSPAVMPAMRMTPSSIIRDSGSISSFCSASASDSMSSSRESGGGATNSMSFLIQGRFSAGAAALSAPREARTAEESDIRLQWRRAGAAHREPGREKLTARTKPAA